MNAQPGGEIILHQRGDAPAIDVRLDGATVSLSREASCREFRQVRAPEHLSVVAEFATTAMGTSPRPNEPEPEQSA